MKIVYKKFYITWVVCINGEKKMKNFFYLLFAFSIKLHLPSSIVCLRNYNFFGFCSFVNSVSSKAITIAVASILFAFFLIFFKPWTLQFTNNSSLRRLKKRLKQIHISKLIRYNNLGLFHIYTESKYQNIWVSFIESLN